MSFWGIKEQLSVWERAITDSIYDLKFSIFLKVLLSGESKTDGDIIWKGSGVCTAYGKGNGAGSVLWSRDDFYVFSTAGKTCDGN